MIVRPLFAVLTLGALLAGCGGDGSSTTAKGQAASASSCATNDVLDQVKGLSPDKREAKLVKLAKAEGGELSLYGVTNLDDLNPMLADFKQRYGFSSKVYSARSTEVYQRTSTENKAKRVGGDVLELDGEFLVRLTEEGALAKVDSPNTAGLIDGTDHGTWVAFQYNVFTLLHNDKNVKAADVPKSYVDLANWKGTLAVSTGNEQPIFAIVQYWMDKLGWTEQQGIDQWKKIYGLKGVRVYDGNSSVVDAVNSGEADLGISFQHYSPQYARRGPSQLAWEPAAEPMVFRENGIGYLCRAPHPALGILYADYRISPEAQQLMADKLGRDTASKDIISGARANTKTPAVTVDIDKWTAASQKWRDLLAALEQEAHKAG